MARRTTMTWRFVLFGIAASSVLAGCGSGATSAPSPSTSPTVVVNGKPMTIQQMSDALGQSIANEVQLQTTVAQMQGHLNTLHDWAQCVDANLDAPGGVSEYCGASEP